MNKNIIEELQWRGLLKQYTNEDKIKLAEQERAAVYCGFDPTASSLHVGHLMMIITLERFKRHNFNAIALIGGATGMIGDPSFKKNERELLSNEQVLKNYNSISLQLKNIINETTFVNNYDWLGKMSLTDFLKDVGKSFNISYLLNKESIASRISSGLSTTEFMYTLLQAYDFYHLYNKYNCKLQIGGSDQWGNITSGIDYISEIEGKENSKAAGITIPLLIKKDGTKFGKTESGAVWLDPKLTSEYDFYQFWLNQNDDDCENMLKFLTFLNKEEIEQIIKTHKEKPFLRLAQKTLANEITLFVHKQKGLDKAISITKAFFEGNLINLEEDTLKQVLESLEIIQINKDSNIIDAIILSKCSSSKREAREFIQQKAISLNNIIDFKEDDSLLSIKTIMNKYIFIKKGKKKYFILELIK